MAAPHHEEDNESLKDASDGDTMEVVHRTNPTCKSLQRDLEKIHTITKTVKADIKHMSEGLDDLNTILTNDEDGILVKLDSLQTSSNQHDVCLSALEEKLDKVVAADNVTLQVSPSVAAEQAALKVRMDTAAIVISTLENQLHSANSRILHNSKLHNTNNYRISGIRYVEGEDPVQAVLTFLKDIMKIMTTRAEILVASHLPGTITVHIKGQPVELPPQMFVKVTPHLPVKIAANISELEDVTDPIDGHYYKVKQQLPDAIQVSRQHFNKVVNDVIIQNKGLPAEKQVSFYFQGTDLYVDGKKVKEPVTPPPRASLLNISVADQRLLDTINPDQLAFAERDGSKFYGFAVHVYDLSFLRKVYLRMRQLHMAANHVMLAYCVETEQNPTKCIEGSCHDGESHGDIILAQAVEAVGMTNVAVFVV